MKTHEIDVTRWTSGSPEATFAALADESRWPDWAPMDHGSLEEPGVGDPHGLGAIRRFETGRTVSIERVVAFEAPTTFAYELLSGLPLRDYRAQVDLRPRRGGTEIHWHSTFHAKVPLTGWIYRLALGRFIGRVADGLAQHVGAPAADDAPAAPR